ncbi:MAG: polysaccharide lyase family protein [Gemmataceae bacterium]
MKLPRSCVARCVILAALLVVFPLREVRGAEPAAPDVTLEEAGGHVVLANGTLTATISRARARLTALRYRGFPMLIDGYYSMDGGKNYRTPGNCRYKVHVRTPDLVDVGFRSVRKDEPQAFDIEVHYVLRRGDSGLYTYALLDHPADYPSTGVGEWRMVWKLSDDLLERIYVDDLRRWQMPGSRDTSEPTEIKEIRKLTSGVRAGKYDCKYDFNANYHDLGCWGHASDKNKVGAWIVLGSHEFFNDGPTKQDLTAAAGINHIHFGMNHYNGSTVRVKAGEAWQKLYGPFLLYCNHGKDGDACWADARSRARAERAAWPHAWLAGNPAYPPASGRGRVTGKLVVDDPLKPHLSGGNAWIGLAQPPAGGNWQFESKNYQFWVKAGADGGFSIPHVRPGTYTLVAFADGAVGEFARPDVRVEAGKTLDLGVVRWTVPHRGKRIAWEIGVPDRTAREFRHGDDYFQGFLWKQFDREFANPLEYTIGKSVPARDWNYAQARYTHGARPVAHDWRSHFDLPTAPAGDATLTLAIASAQRARIQVYVNDGTRPVAEVTPAVQGGNALLREGIHAKYGVEYVTIPAGHLKAGKNTIGLVLASVRGADTHVMYDYLNLELP